MMVHPLHYPINIYMTEVLSHICAQYHEFFYDPSFLRISGRNNNMERDVHRNDYILRGLKYPVLYKKETDRFRAFFLYEKPNDIDLNYLAFYKHIHKDGKFWLLDVKSNYTEFYNETGILLVKN